MSVADTALATAAAMQCVPLNDGAAALAFHACCRLPPMLDPEYALEGSDLQIDEGTLGTVACVFHFLARS